MWEDPSPIENGGEVRRYMYVASDERYDEDRERRRVGQLIVCSPHSKLRLPQMTIEWINCLALVVVPGRAGFARNSVPGRRCRQATPKNCMCPSANAP